MNKLKNQNGITLIALVITIIVMLILVAVTITMAVNGGLFDYARKAGQETNRAVEAEKQLASGKVEIGGVWFNTFDEYVEGPQHNWTRTGDSFKCSHCNEEYEMGQLVDYTAAGKTSTTITAEKSGAEQYYENNDQYMTWKANVDEEGNQIIEVQDTNWVVLGIEDTNKDGINETLLITSENAITPTEDEQCLFFYGGAGYYNGPEEIHRICKELYSNSEYGLARGMTVEDVNSVFNYPTARTYTKLKDLDEFDDVVANGTYSPKGEISSNELGEYEVNKISGYSLVNNSLTLESNDDTTIQITEEEKNVVFTIDGYFLASSNNFLSSDCIYFGMGNVWGQPNNRVNYYCDMCISNESGFYEYEFEYRPVVSLQYNLPEPK